MPRQKITKRKDGRYSAMVSLGHDPATGRLKRRTVYGKTKSEVRAKIAALEREIASGAVTPGTRSDLTVSQWGREWLETFVAARREGTRRIYRSLLEADVLPAIGALRLDRLSAGDCQRMVNELGKRLSPNMVRQVATTAGTMLGKAVELGYIPKNPMAGVELPKAERVDIHPFDEGEMAAFLKASGGSRYHALYRVLLLSGLRISEALALTWDDVGESVLTVSKQFAANKSNLTPQPTKNGKARRVAMSVALKSAFGEARRLQTADRLAAGPAFANESGLVFTDESGGRLIKATVWRDFKKWAAAVGCPEARLHDLRHTYAVLNLKAGVDPKTLSESLGHSSVSFTLDKYAYVTDEMRRESGERLDGLLRRMGITET